MAPGAAAPGFGACCARSESAVARTDLARSTALSSPTSFTENSYLWCNARATGYGTSMNCASFFTSLLKYASTLPEAIFEASPPFFALSASDFGSTPRPVQVCVTAFLKLR